MTDFHTLDELIEARKLLAFMSGVLGAAAKTSKDGQSVRDHYAKCAAEIDAFLKRPLFQDQEAA